MTEHQIASAVGNYVTSHEGVTNFPVSPEQIAEEVDTMRGRLIAEMDRAREFSRPFVGFTQEMILPTNEAVATIPRIYTLLSGRPAVAYAGGLNGKSPFKIVYGNGRYTATHDLFTHDASTIWIGEGKLEILNDNADKILLIAVFEDPSALAEYGYDDGFPDGEGSDYPVPPGLIDMIIGKTAESYMRHMYRIFPQPNTQSDIPSNPNVQRR